MKSSTDYKVTDSFACLLVGEPKTGKTNLAMGFPDPWFLDLDLNLSSAVRRTTGKKFYYDTVKDIPGPQKYNECEKLLKAAIADPNVKTIVVDGLSSLSEIVKEYIFGQLKQAGLDKKLRQDTVDDQLRQADYQTVNTLVLRLVALCRASGKYVIWTSHQKADKDDVTGRMLFKLHMPGNLSSNLGAYFTDVWATVAEPGPVTPQGQATKYTLRTKPTGYHVNLGASFDIAGSVDLTDKKPEQIWSLIAPKMGATV